MSPLPNVPLLPAPPDPLRAGRRLVAGRLHRLLGSDRFPDEQYTDPPGDPGLFGPDSVTWYVHADLSMLVGGIAALMLQTLHPLAMAAVADHSDYRIDPLRRLSRTSSFVVATTYGATPVAEAVIEAVRAVHRRVIGRAPDGRPYAAEDPELLRWVHVAEVTSFLRAHRRYHPWPIRGSRLDRYFAETAVIAERLGATDVPTTRLEVGRYLRDIRPELDAGPQAREAMAFLLRPQGSDPFTVSVTALVTQAAVGLLPGWALERHGIARPLLSDPLIRPTTWALLAAARALIGPSPVVAQARLRCRAVPTSGPRGQSAAA